MENSQEDIFWDDGSYYVSMNDIFIFIIFNFVLLRCTGLFSSCLTVAITSSVLFLELSEFRFFGGGGAAAATAATDSPSLLPSFPLLLFPPSGLRREYELETTVVAAVGGGDGRGRSAAIYCRTRHRR